ncbi:hypothetical protein PR202_gb16348 [Eleusine coracana subsp. coracana]|uniref:Transcription factor MYC/MYB N-terminal domain-containing protein n=1 Tax=Eleusine coracana subsp. coracana TaxID=191504 RepID=A0AAV5EXU4_ELECO|nr:hypothetical protein PR202_gb16348 [Eleusine coracana subsp. coracana]
MAVGDALRRLCEEIGWSYAVFWKAIGAADPVHLVWEDGYCGHTSCPAGSETSEALPTDVRCSAADGTMCSLVKKVMASQVHVVGEGYATFGTVGRAAFTGNHQWIVHGTANGHGLPSEVAAEMNYQFEAGIQTIAIIPVLPRGVLQLGSTGLHLIARADSEGNTQSADMSSGLVWPSLISVKKQSLLLNNTGSFGFSNNADSSADLARNILLKSLACRDSSADEKCKHKYSSWKIWKCPMRDMILKTLISSLEVAE